MINNVPRSWETFRSEQIKATSNMHAGGTSTFCRRSLDILFSNASTFCPTYWKTKKSAKVALIN